MRAIRLCITARRFQSTLPSQGATLFRAFDTRPPQISIHAPLTGSDTVLGYDGDILVKFQSTLPSQGATKLCSLFAIFFKISIHAPLTGSDKYGGCECFNECRFQSTLPSQGATFSSPSVQASQNISIHAPLTGSDLEHVVTYGGIWISIHAPLTGSDAYTFQTLRFGYNFNPRSPHRERRMKNSGSS